MPLYTPETTTKTAGSGTWHSSLPPDPCHSGPVALLAWQPESRWPILYASPSAAQILGQRPESQDQALGYMSLIHPDDLEQVTGEVLHHLNAGHGSWAQSYRILRPDGGVRWLYDLRVVQRDESGAPRMLYGYVLDETEHKSWEEAFRLLAETSMQAVWIGAEQGFLYANPSALRLTGHGLAELKDLGWRELIAPREQACLPALLAQVEIGAELQTALWLRRIDGGESLVDLRFRRLADGRLLAIGRLDGQGLPSTPPAQTPVDPLLQGLIRAFPDPAWLKDPQGVYLACNARFATSIGAAESEIIGRSDESLFDPEIARRLQLADQEALASGGTLMREGPIGHVRGEGRDRYETLRIPLRAADGGPIGVLGIARGLGEQHRMQEELCELRAIYQAILDQATDSIVLIHGETLRFLDFNDVACRTLGYTRDEFKRLGIPDIQADLSPRRLAYWRDRINCAGWGDLETIHRAKNGQLHPVAVTNRRVETRQGPCWVAIWRDLRERKRIDAELAIHRTQLETLVGSRTIEIERARLQAECEGLLYRQLLAALSQAVMQALGASHKPNQQGMDAVTAQTPAGDGGDGHGAQSDEGARSGTALLEIAEACHRWLLGERAGRETKAALAPRQYLERLVRLLGKEAAAKGIQLTWAVDPELPSAAREDAAVLERLLLMLTAQAIDSSPPGRISLRAGLAGLRLGVPVVRFEIECPAIPQGSCPSEVPADPLAALPLGGTVLRLAVARSLAEQLGGALAIDPKIHLIRLDLPWAAGEQ